MQADRHALGQQTVKFFVNGQQIGRMDPQHFFDRLRHHLTRQPVVDAPCRLRQPILQQHLGVAAALRVVAVGGDARAVQVGVAQPFKEFDGEGFDGGFGDHAGRPC